MTAWTKTTPTVPGWYWMRDGGGKRVVHVRQLFGQGALHAVAVEGNGWNVGLIGPVDSGQREWQGPLEAKP